MVGDNNDRTVTLRYRVGRHGHGSMMNGTGCYVAVDQDYELPDTGHLDAPIHISHPNILQLLFVNVNEENGRKDGVFEPFTMTLRQLIGNDDFSQMWIRYDDPPAKYLALSHKARNIFACLFRVLGYLHSMNLSFGMFKCLDMDNFVFCGSTHTVKMWKVPFTVTSYSCSRKRDYTLVTDFIDLLLRPIIVEYNQALLPDMFDTLSYRLLKYKGGRDDELLARHVALMTSSEKIILMQNMVNKVPFLKRKPDKVGLRSELEEYGSALHDLGDNRGWLLKLTLRDCFPMVLKSLNRHFNKDSDIPFDRSNIDYKNQVQQLIDSLRIGRNGVPHCDDGGGWDKPAYGERRIQINRSLIRTVRNLATRLPESFPTGSHATEGKIAAAILSIFNQEVEMFQKNLCDRGILYHFMPHGHFGEDTDE